MKYYIVWIEGIGVRSGEKIKSFTNTGFEYTNLMTESMRVKESDIQQVLHYLKRHGIADFVLNSPNTFIRTSYVPKGTLLNLKRIAL